MGIIYEVAATHRYPDGNRERLTSRVAAAGRRFVQFSRTSCCRRTRRDHERTNNAHKHRNGKHPIGVYFIKSFFVTDILLSTKLGLNHTNS